MECDHGCPFAGVGQVGGRDFAGGIAFAGRDCIGGLDNLVGGMFKAWNKKGGWSRAVAPQYFW